MNFKACILAVAFMAIGISTQAQSARNRLNLQPANIKLHTGTSHKKIVAETYYKADDTQFDKYTYEYNENSIKSACLYQIWSSKNNEWTNISKNVYSSNQQTTTSIFKNWQISDWQNSSKTEYTYNTSGKKTSSIYYTWDDSSEDWSKAYSKDSWSYDGNGHMTQFTEQQWNNKTSEWETPTTKIIYSYDDNGNQTEELLQYWNAESNAWTNSGKYTYSYDETNQKTICKSYVASGEKWIFDGKIVCIYDKDGDMTRCEYYGTNTDESLNAYCIYTYSSTVGTINATTTENITVYPNPASTTTEMTLPEKLIGKTAYIFDASGILINSFVISNTKTTVNVSSFSAGIYFIKIDNYSEKILVKR